MSDLVIGIDLGTTNSVVALADGTDVRVLVDEGGSRLIPSVVSFHPDGRVLVGVDARDRRLIDAPNTVYSVKRLIGRPFRSPEVGEAQKRFAFRLKESANGGVLVLARNDSYTLTEISAFVLREVKRIAELSIGRTVTKAVITVPAAFNELQRSATKAAGRVAGLEVLRIVNEPTAAALAYGIGTKKKERVAVYDLGGGTFDLTLLDLENDVFEVLGSEGDSFLGGDDVDALIADAMAEAFLAKHRYDPRQHEQTFERVRAAAEWLKCQLSDAATATTRVEDLTVGPGGASLHLEHTMTRADLEKLIAPLVDRSLTVCTKALADAGITKDELDAVILVGGSTRVPFVRRKVESFFGLAPRGNIDPDLVVAQGAAIHGYAIAGKKSDKGVGRVPLKRMTVQDVMAVQKRRADQRAAGPKQDAFAPTGQVQAPAQSEAAAAPVGPKIPAPRTGPVVPPPAGAAPRPAPPARPVPRPAVQTARVAVVGKPAPNLPPPRPRVSTVPPAPPTAIAVPIDIPVPGIVGGAAAATRIGAPPPSDSLAREAAALDAAVLRASLAPPTASPASASKDDGSTIFLLDELDPLPELPPAPAAPVIAPLVARPGTPSDILELDDDAVSISLSEPPAATDFFADSPLPTNFATQAAAAPVAVPGIVAQPEARPGATVVLPVPAPAPEPPPAPEPAPLPDVALPMNAAASPLLLDVTPLSLGVETVGGYCQTIIRRNVPIPCEATRSFTTGADRQESVVIKICQGESRTMADNQMLGAVELSGLRAGTRGTVRIAVTFEIDASGILDVRAVDELTGGAQQTRIRLLGGADEAEIEAMRSRQQKILGGT